MTLGGLQKTTLVDFPGRVACTVFTVGCNFRCPFCHNRDLVTSSKFQESKIQVISQETFFEFLKGRIKILDGVCITGGEPTLQPDLEDFCRKIKSLGLLVKLDTNGGHPEIVKKLLDQKLLDFIAMDLKGPWEDYSKISKFEQVELVKQTILLTVKSNLEYEFRTTVVPDLHSENSLIKLASDLVKLTGCSDHDYFLQNFRGVSCLDSSYNDRPGFSSTQLQSLRDAVAKILPKTKTRE
ncbi:MAG: anaerobic ribonucleoside-triphosphate reductase activating protein [candidate division WWE3 bacterium]|nr:anaerobic ribonucleoside-triphosphate reductase activating protein [candidate division WWE3 bacterium]